MAMDIKPDTKSDMGLDIPGGVKADKPAKPKGKGGKTFFTLLIIVIILVAAGYLVDSYTDINLFGTSMLDKDSGASMDYNQNSFHAVFLSNGQVYFGKINKADDDFTILAEIYYLQVSNPLQQVPPSETPQQPQLTLVKLGNELHGPKDYMKINNRQIIFVEELKSDSRVVEAIEQYKIDNI